MRISRPGPSFAAGVARADGAPAASAGTFGVRSGGGPVGGGAGGGIGGVLAAFSMGSVGALMALQALPDATGRRQRSSRRGGRLLDGLEEVHRALLDGELPGRAVADLRGELALPGEAADDPALADLLREIEVRVAVELAKLELGNA